LESVDARVRLEGEQTLYQSQNATTLIGAVQLVASKVFPAVPRTDGDPEWD
jgi:hypothetical protein